jgi:hypothetical protein
MRYSYSYATESNRGYLPNFVNHAGILLRLMRMSYLKTYVVLLILRRIVIVTIFIENID